MTTPGTQLAVPGLYPGARYCDTELFRPTYDSKMRSLNRPFDQINTEQHIRRIYNFVSPLDSWTPTYPFLSADASNPAAFSVAVLEPLTHSLSIVWNVDNASIGTGTSFTASNVAAGVHEVTATVRDPTGLVRGDPSLLLTETHRWTLTVLPQTPTALVLTRIDPPVLEVGAGAATLLVSGRGSSGGGMIQNGARSGVGPASFVPGAVVRIDGSDRPTVFVSPSLLQATISVADRQSPGAHLITVVNPATGGAASNSLTLTVVSPTSRAPASSPRTLRRVAVEGTPAQTAPAATPAIGSSIR